jgi:protein ImuA
MNAIVEDLVQRHPTLWRGAGHVQHQGPASVPTGHARLDAQLPGGGWPPGCITELMVRALGTGEWRLLAPALQRLAQSGRHILLLAPPHIPHAPALAALGLPTEQFLVVRARHAADRLWALEQSLRSNRFGALIAWLDATTKPEALRRFQLAARNAQGPGVLFWSFTTLACAPAAGALATPLPGPGRATAQAPRPGVGRAHLGQCAHGQPSPSPIGRGPCSGSPANSRTPAPPASSYRPRPHGCIPLSPLRPCACAWPSGRCSSHRMSAWGSGPMSSCSRSPPVFVSGVGATPCCISCRQGPSAWVGQVCAWPTPRPQGWLNGVSAPLARCPKAHQTFPCQWCPRPNPIKTASHKWASPPWGPCSTCPVQDCADDLERPLWWHWNLPWVNDQTLACPSVRQRSLKKALSLRCPPTPRPSWSRPANVF